MEGGMEVWREWTRWWLSSSLSPCKTGSSTHCVIYQHTEPQSKFEFGFFWHEGMSMNILGMGLNLRRRNKWRKREMMYMKQDLSLTVKACLPNNDTRVALEIRSFPLHPTAGKFTSARESSRDRKQSEWQRKLRKRHKWGLSLALLSDDVAPNLNLLLFRQQGAVALGRGPEGQPISTTDWVLAKNSFGIWYLLWR